jgi:predicted permease
MARVAGLIGRGRKEREMAAELESHLAHHIEDNLRAGMTAEEARRQALIKLGGLEQAKDVYRERRGIPLVENTLRDLSYGARMLRKSPGFAIVGVLTLGLGIGANTAIFSVIEGVLFRPLPFPAPDQIVRIYSTKDGKPIAPNGSGFYGGPSPMDMRDFAQSNHTFQGMAVYDTWRKNVSFDAKNAEPEQMWVGLVPGAYFQVLGIEPMMGRLFTEEESYVGKHYVAAISARLWRIRFASDRAVLGRKILINAEPYTIVAVMPDVIPEWMESRAIQIWTPFGFADSLGDIWTEAGRGGRGWYSLGRMKRGVSMEQAQADLSAVAAGLAAAHPVDRGIGVGLEKLSDTRAHNLRSMLFLLMGAVSLILLIACVNLANLLLARNSLRERELALRAALGAARGRLLRQLLAETLLLSSIGGGVGLVLAWAGVASLTRMHPDDLPQLASIALDWRVLSFTVLVSLITSLLFGLGPALTGSRPNLIDTLKLGSRSGTAGSNAQRMRSVLVTLEVALSLMLLVAASLLVQSVLHLEQQQLGIRQDHLLKGHFYLPGVRYPSPRVITSFCDQFAERVRALPGVVGASVTTIYPPNYNWSQMLEIPGRPATRVQDIPTAQFGLTDAHFLRTLGIPLIQGRDFNESDTATSPPVALVNRELQRRYFPTRNPIGERIHIGPPQFLHVPPGAMITDSADVTIIGVIGDFKNSGLALPPEPQIIVLYSQHPLVNYGFKDIVVRTASNPHALVPEITRQLHEMDADMPFAQVQTIDELVEQLTGSQRFTMVLLALFAAAGLALAAVGIYGVVSFLVAQRSHELAVRVAVGASVANVLWLVMKQGLRLAATGAFIGFAGTWATQKLISDLLFGISPVDPLTLAGSAAFLVAVVVLACWVPSWRAARVDPCIALKAE